MSLARVKNWKEFQHYKDRSPTWIKLHRKLLDNREYARLTPIAGKMLPLIWLIASEKDGRLPDDLDDLAFRLRVSVHDARSIVAELIRCGFLVTGEAADELDERATPAQRAGLGSRHIPDAVKRVVWERDGGKCCECESQDHIEYDHKIPVSAGGSSEIDNIQLLCRTCNRRKRTRVAAPAEQGATQKLNMRSLGATQKLNMRSLEGEGEEEREEEKKITNPSDLSSPEAGDSSPAEPEDQKAPQCPHAAIVALYHEVLPSLPRVREWTDARQALLRKRWAESTERQSLDWWREFFAYVGRSDFLMGRKQGRGGDPFECDLEWLIRPKNFIKVIEGRYENRGVAA